MNKQWRQVADEYFESSIVPEPYDDKAYLEKLEMSPNQLYLVPKFDIVKKAYKFDTETELNNFNKFMKDHMNSEFSPFVGGAVVILSNLFVNSSALSPATKLFMEKFGVRIRRLVIIQEEKERHSDFDIVGFVNCERKCLPFRSKSGKATSKG